MRRSDRKDSGGKSAYAIGYGRPPEGSRFKPGQSGNPSGRPRGRRRRKDLPQLLDELFAKRLTVTENGRRKSFAAIELVLTRLLRDAIRGDIRATHQVLKLVERYPPQPEPARVEDDLGAGIRDKLERMARNIAAEHERAERLRPSAEPVGSAGGAPSHDL